MVNISVIIPVYNTAKYLDDCINSVVCQTYDNWELILVDDGSTDDSGQICDTFASKDKRIHVLHQANHGRSMARKSGVEAAHGEWCCFIDSDDKIPHDSLQLLSNRICGDTDIIFGNGYTLGQDYKQYIDIDTFRHMAVRGDGTIGVPWGTLFRRKLLTHYVFDVSREFYMGEDYIFWLRVIFSTSKPVAVVAEPVYTKGFDTTSKRFVWTSDYAGKIQRYRMEAIPQKERGLYMKDTISDRIANLCAVTISEPRHTWENSIFYKQLLQDMKKADTGFSSKQRLFLSLPSRHLRRLYSILSNKIHHN